MSESENVTVVNALIDAFYRGDIDAIIDACAEDVTGFVPGPDIIPFAGHFQGRQAMREFFAMIPKTYDTIDMEVHDVIATGNKVVMNGHEKGVVKSTGKAFDNHWVMVWTIHNGVVTDVFEYHDTAAIAEAFTP